MIIITVHGNRTLKTKQKGEKKLCGYTITNPRLQARIMTKNKNINNYHFTMLIFE